MARTSRPARSLALLAAAWLLAGAACADEPAPRPRIYSCVVDGKRITSDRPNPACGEQRQLNADGSLYRIVPRPLTEDERSDMEQRQRQSEIERAQRADAIRRDRNLVQRYPDNAAHRKGREKALDDIRKSVAKSNDRIILLTAERKPLLEEAEFYAGKTLPNKLKLALDANDASLAAQKALIQNQEIEVKRIDDLFDVELARLKKLWAGTPAGSLGPLPAGAASSAPGVTQAVADKRPPG